MSTKEEEPPCVGWVDFIIDDEDDHHKRVRLKPRKLDRRTRHQQTRSRLCNL